MKHQHVMRKQVVEGGWVQKRLHDITWSEKKECHGCGKEARRSTGFATVQAGKESEMKCLMN